MTELKPVEEMTAAEIAAERARIAAARAELLGTETATAAAEPAAEPASAEAASEDPDTADAPWPHQVIEISGHKLEVRKPSESALLALTMAQAGGLPVRQVMAVFSNLLSHHMSERSYFELLSMLSSGEASVGVVDVVQALIDLPE